MGSSSRLACLSTEHLQIIRKSSKIHQVIGNVSILDSFQQTRAVSSAVVLLPLFHLDNLVSVQSSHLQLSVEVSDGESHQVLVSDTTL